METRARYALIGLFMFAVILASFGFVYWLENKGGFGERKTYLIQFESSVSGLLVGSAVLFNGIRVGDVTNVALNPDGKAGVLGSHLPFGDLRRGWNFCSLGRGNIDFEKIIRELNTAQYEGPLSVEWEDSGMDREFGATEALGFVRRLDFKPSALAFDDAMRNE